MKASSSQQALIEENDKYFNEKRTLIELFKKCVGNVGSKPALRVESPLPKLEKPGVAESSKPLEEWKSWSYQEYYDQSSAAAQGFIKLGLQKGEGVNVLAFNSPEWFMSYMGCIMAGGLIGGLYATDNSEILTYKSKLSSSGVICVDSEANLQKIIDIADEVSYVKAIVYWGFETNKSLCANGRVTILSWDSLLKLGGADEKKEVEERIEQLNPEECCVLVFTSGTTGMPKAVRISHDNIIFDCYEVTKQLPLLGSAEKERVLSYLPLSHVAGMLVDIILPMGIGAIKAGNNMTTYFARSYDLKAATISDRLRIVKPTLFFGVPRVWEKIMEKMKAIGAQTKGLKKSIGAWAKAKGLEYIEAQQFGGSQKVPFLFGLADALVFSKIKEALGLSECNYCVTGAAPIQPECIKYFASLNINILEVYGMSECCGGANLGMLEAFKWGSPGRSISGTETKCFLIDEATGKKTECPLAKNPSRPTEEEQGEICMRGRHVMLGYHCNPDLGESHVKEIEKKNKETVDEEGWLHSGDKGCLDAEGFLHITGRYKELIIGAGGENIAPIPVENAFKNYCPAISNCMMVGDKQKFNVALLTLKAQGATGELAGSDKLEIPAAEYLHTHGEKTTVTTIGEACHNEKYINQIIEALKQTNNDPKAIISQPYKIQKFTILPYDFSIENGELTSTLKTKRSVVAQMHDEAIQALYSPDNNKATYVPYPNLQAIIASGNGRATGGD